MKKTQQIILLAAILPLASCNWVVQKLDLWKIGIGEKEFPKLEEPHRQPEQQPNKAQIIAEKNRIKRKETTNRFGSDIHSNDPFSSRGGQDTVGPAQPPSSATGYKSSF